MLELRLRLVEKACFGASFGGKLAFLDSPGIAVLTQYSINPPLHGII